MPGAGLADPDSAGHAALCAAEELQTALEAAATAGDLAAAGQFAVRQEQLLADLCRLGQPPRVGGLDRLRRLLAANRTLTADLARRMQDGARTTQRRRQAFAAYAAGASGPGTERETAR